MDEKIPIGHQGIIDKELLDSVDDGASIKEISEHKL